MVVSMARALKCDAVKVAEKRATMTDFVLKRLANGTLKPVIDKTFSLLDRIGFDSVDAGTISESWRQQISAAFFASRHPGGNARPCPNMPRDVGSA
jgi:hypothetical protein